MSYDTVADIYALGVLTPIIAGREGPLRRYLRLLATGLDSPLERVTGTHFARWLIITDPTYEGPPQKPGSLKSNYLLFTAYFDGSTPDPYIHDLITRCGETHEIYGHCVGYPGPDPAAFAAYLRHNHIDTTLLYLGYAARVGQVRASLDLRRRLTEFAIAHEGCDEETLRADWRAAFSPTEAPGR